MNSLNKLEDICLNKLILREHVYLHNKLLLNYDEIKTQQYLFNILKNNLYKLLNTGSWNENTTIMNIKTSNIFDDINESDKIFNISKHNVYPINLLCIEPLVKRLYKYYVVTKFIIILFAEDYEGNIFINKYRYSDIKRGTLFIFPYSIMFNIAFDCDSTSKVIVSYITEKVKIEKV